jgi:hypothetical protein
MHPAFADSTQRRGDRRGLQSVESGLQTAVIACTGAAAGEGEDLAWPSGQEARRAEPGVSGLDKQAGGPDQSQIVAMPCSVTASTRMAISFIRKSIWM